MKELAIVKYIKENGLAKALMNFKLKSNIYQDKILLKYDMIESPMGCIEVQECRGLILERDTWKVINMAFSKFFNYGEGHAAQIDWNTANILMKVDGSLISMYKYNGKWYASTTGTAEGEGEVNNRPNTTFADLFWETMKKVSPTLYNNLNSLAEGVTYIFELTTPYNIVVAPHSESSITLLGARNLNTLEELNYETLSDLALMYKIPLVKSYDLNVDNPEELAKTLIGLPYFEEGYVVVDANFNRIKIKNPAYLNAHHLKDKSALHNIMGIVKTNEIEEFAATFVERREELYSLKEKYDILISNLENCWGEIKNHKPKNITPKERKKFAMNVFEISKKYSCVNFTGLFFGLFDGKIDNIKDYMFEYDNRTLYKLLK